MKTKISILSAIIILFAFFSGCEEDDSAQNGTMSLSITDTPIDNEEITGVYIKINGLEYHSQDSGWQTFEEYEGPKTFNLLELTDGVDEMLGTFEMEAGQYNQLRFLMDIPNMGQGQPTNPGCYLKFKNGDSTSLFVPSGGQSGYKAVGAFQVPSNGTVELLADWDARKAVVKTGAAQYILRPTIRLIAKNEAGSIAGGISNIPDAADNIIIYAYEDDIDQEDIDKEAAAPAEEETRFSNAVTSAEMGEENNYKLWYLAPMTYDLIVVKYVDGEYHSVLGKIEDVKVESNSNTNAPIDISEL